MSSSSRTCAKPKTALRGVLSSWLIRDKNAFLERFAESAAARAVSRSSRVWRRAAVRSSTRTMAYSRRRVSSRITAAVTSAAARPPPRMIHGGGLAAALVTAAVIRLLTRRREYAMVLVDERTAALRQTLDDLETARAAADSANRSKNAFLSRMSHELRTPLNAVLGFAQVLELDDIDNDQREAVEQILKGGNHLLELINEVLDIS